MLLHKLFAKIVALWTFWAGRMPECVNHSAVSMSFRPLEVTPAQTVAHGISMLLPFDARVHAHKMIKADASYEAWLS